MDPLYGARTLCGLHSSGGHGIRHHAVVLSARYFSVLDRCPAIVFLLCGIFPLVPGAGVFWTSYYVVSDQLRLALGSGFMAVKVTIAIVLGIILISELPARMFSGRKAAKAFHRNA